MSHKRKVARKLKKTIRKQAKIVKRNTNASSNQDTLLKLMAVMNNKPAQQPSMDPAKFLQMQEAKADRENEIRKI